MCVWRALNLCVSVLVYRDLFLFVFPCFFFCFFFRVGWFGVYGSGLIINFALSHTENISPKVFDLGGKGKFY